MNKPNQKPMRELTDDQLEHVTGGDTYLHHPRGTNNSTTTTTSSDSGGEGGGGTDRSN